MSTATVQTDSKRDLVLERVVDVPKGTRVGCLDRAGAHQEMVHAGAVDDR